MDTNGKEKDTSSVLTSRLTINFSAPGAADFVPEFDNVTPAQMLAAASWLEWRAKSQFSADLHRQMQEQSKNQIQISAGGLRDLKKRTH